MGISLTHVDVLTALGHGILSFFSPCAVPLIPSFIALLLSEKSLKGFLRIVGFFVGISGTFSVLGAFSGQMGGLFTNAVVTRYVAGSIILLMGLLFFLQVRVVNFKAFNLWKYRTGGFFAGMFVGIGIGLVWIPCSSPILASILVLASAKETAVRGAFMLFVYSLGISIPFLTIGGLVAKLMSRFSLGEAKWEKIIRYISSILLGLIGVLIIFGKLFF